MRADQWIGLNDRAQKMLTLPRRYSHLEVTIRRYPDGRQEKHSRRVYASPVEHLGPREVEGAFGGVAGYLSSWRMPDGTVFEEAIQATPWASGPLYFIALRRDGRWVRESLWTEAEMLEADGVDPRRYLDMSRSLDQQLDEELAQLEAAT